MDDYNVRKYTTGDGRAVMDIFNYFVENSHAAYPEKNVDLVFVEKLEGLAIGGSFYVVEAPGRIIGFGLLRKHHACEVFNRTAELTYFILPEHARRGLESRLLTMLINDAKKADVDTLLANISSLNEGSIIFHKRAWLCRMRKIQAHRKKKKIRTSTSFGCRSLSMNLGKTQIKDLSERIDLIPHLARWHFRQWGELTGVSSEADYATSLFRSVSAPGLPLTLVAVSDHGLLGSVNIVDCDMDIWSELKPWLAQLYVRPQERGRGIGSGLVCAAVERSRRLGFDCLYLYTSGTLPSFYERLGWSTREMVYYKGKERTVMETKTAYVKSEMHG